MGRAAWSKLGANYRVARRTKEDELRDRIGHEEFLRLAKLAPNSFVELARECLSRVQNLPVFPTEPPSKLKVPQYAVDVDFLREFAEGSLTLAKEVAAAGKFGNSLQFLKRAYSHLEWLANVGPQPFDSPLREGAKHLAEVVRFHCEAEFDKFTYSILMTLSDAVLLGLVESAECSKSLEDFVLGEVARIRAENAGDPGSLEGATMPHVAKGPDAEHAVALLGQLTGLIESNPSILEDLLPRLSELVQLVERHRPASTERTLNARQAGRRIGISHVQVLRLLEDGRLGERDAEGSPRFSEQECDVYRESERKRGRPTKSDTAS